MVSLLRGQPRVMEDPPLIKEWLLVWDIGQLSTAINSLFSEIVSFIRTVAPYIEGPLY